MKEFREEAVWYGLRVKGQELAGSWPTAEAAAAFAAFAVTPDGARLVQGVPAGAKLADFELTESANSHLYTLDIQRVEPVFHEGGFWWEETDRGDLVRHGHPSYWTAESWTVSVDRDGVELYAACTPLYKGERISYEDAAEMDAADLLARVRAYYAEE